jgi:hypothetical protein
MKRPNRNELLPKNNFQGTYKRYSNDKDYIKALEAYIDEIEKDKNITYEPSVGVSEAEVCGTCDKYRTCCDDVVFDEIACDIYKKQT